MKLSCLLLLLSGIAMCIGLNVFHIDRAITTIEFVSTPTAIPTATATSIEHAAKEIDIHYGTALQSTLLNAIRATRNRLSVITASNHLLGLHRRRQVAISSLDAHAVTDVTVFCDGSTRLRIATSNATASLASTLRNLTTDSNNLVTKRTLPSSPADRLALAIDLAEGNFKHADQNEVASVTTTTSTYEYRGATWFLTRTSTIIIDTVTTSVSLPRSGPLLTASPFTTLTPTVTDILHLSSMPIISESGFCHYKDSDIVTPCMQAVEPTSTIIVATASSTASSTAAATAATSAAAVMSGANQGMDNPIGSAMRFIKELFK